MFNVFLPKMLEMQTGGEVGGQPKSLKQTMWDVVIFTIAGCPGAIVCYTTFIPLRNWLNYM